MDELTTLQSIHRAGKKEFLKKGFKSASLRSIVKDAGVTTGAFYGYYRSKEKLFEALVGEQAEVMLERFEGAQREFAMLPPRLQKEEMGKISGACMDWMLDYVYQHLEVFKLLILCSEGTKYEHFVHKMVESEVKGTHKFIQSMHSLGQNLKEIDPQLEHILITGMFNGFFEMVVHDMSKAQAVEYVKELRQFYTAGWQAVLGY